MDFVWRNKIIQNLKLNFGQLRQQLLTRIKFRTHIILFVDHFVWNPDFKVSLQCITTYLIQNIGQKIILTPSKLIQSEPVAEYRDLNSMSSNTAIKGRQVPRYWPLSIGKVWRLIILKNKSSELPNVVLWSSKRFSTNQQTSCRKHFINIKWLALFWPQQTCTYKIPTGPLVLYRSPECWRYVASEQTWRYKSTQRSISCHPYRSIRNKLDPVIKWSRSTQGHYLKKAPGHGHTTTWYKFWQHFKGFIIPIILYQSRKIPLASLFYIIFFFFFFIHVYKAPGYEETPLGTFFCKQNGLITLITGGMFKKIALPSHFMHIFHGFIYVHSPWAGKTTH